jgi:hypothetical protein
VVKDILPPQSTEDPQRAQPPAAPDAARESERPKFVGGDAMAALLRSADVKVSRGEETRVLSRPNELLADLERRNPGSVSEPPAADPHTFNVPSTHPPRPRVDTALWVVLAVGLFAIAGWMLAYSL